MKCQNFDWHLDVLRKWNLQCKTDILKLSVNIPIFKDLTWLNDYTRNMDASWKCIGITCAIAWWKSLEKRPKDLWALTERKRKKEKKKRKIQNLYFIGCHIYKQTHLNDKSFNLPISSVNCWLRKISNLLYYL